MLKVNRVDEKKKAKLFTGGKPQDFELVAKNQARIKGTLTTSGKAYKLFAGNVAHEMISTSMHEFDSAALREAAEHFAELADILDGKVVTQAAA